MQWLASLCIRQPVFTWVLMLVFIVIGTFGYFSLGVDQFPKIDFPAVVVTTTENGAAPEEIETQLTDKIEGAVNTISGIDELRSTSSQGVSLVIIAFTLDKNPDVAAQEVRDHINNVLPDLPKGIDQPVVSKVDPDASPILYVTLSAPGSIRDTTELADKRVRRQIESINGVGQVNILGGKKRQINLWLDPLKLEATGLTAVDVERALAQQNLSVPGGQIETGPKSLSLRVEGRVDDVAKIGASSSRRARTTRRASATWRGSRMGPRSRRPRLPKTARRASFCRSASSQARTRWRSSTRSKRDWRGPEDSPSGVRAPRRARRVGVDPHERQRRQGAPRAGRRLRGRDRAHLPRQRAEHAHRRARHPGVHHRYLRPDVGHGLHPQHHHASRLALAVGIVIDDAIVVLENIVRFIEQKKQKPFVAAALATRDIGLAVLATTLS
jgi:HAE1 family hydrophobic/amphiphilic exporter-1